MKNDLLRHSGECSRSKFFEIPTSGSYYNNARTRPSLSVHSHSWYNYIVPLPGLELSAVE